MLPRTRRLLLPVVAAALLAACSSILPGADTEPKATYRITTPEVTTAMPAVGQSLVVGAPSAAPGLDSNRVAVWQNPQRLEYYEGARWVDDAPDMLRGALIDAFRSTGSLTGVGRRSIDLNPNWRLDTRLSEFEAGYRDGAEIPTVEVTVDASLLREPSQDVAATRSFSATARPASPAVPDVIAAYDEATHQVVRDVVGWSLRMMSAGGGA